jgi:peptidoglycan DL-endopeptidase CwlO
MSVSSIAPYTTLAELQELKLPAAVSANTIVTAPTVTESSTPVQTVPQPAPPSPLVSALNLTLAEFGLTTDPLAAASPTGTTTSTTSSATTPSLASEATPVNTQASTQATQNFIGALYQAASGTQAASASTESAANQAAASNATDAQLSYTGTQFNLATVLQQIDDGTETNAANPNLNTAQATESSAIATLQANFEDLLNTASAVNSQAVAAANSASPTLQSFVQTLAQNIPDQVSAVSAINPLGTLLETSA